MTWGTALELAVQQQVTPGGIGFIGSGSQSGPRLICTSGRLSSETEASQVDESTIYDLASLTKVLCTTILTAQAVADAKLDLDECPFSQWPNVSIKHILNHTGGLPAWQPLFEEVNGKGYTGLPAGRTLTLNLVLANKPLHPPGEQVLYSDLGFIALGALIEERYGERLDHLTNHFWNQRIGPHTLCFIPLFEQGYHQEIHRVASSENCPWRLRVIRGQVHDDNCFAMGGIAGHAGLFGCIADVEKACRYLLSCIKDPRSPLETLIQTFASFNEKRPLGFDQAEPGGSTGGVFPSTTVGHLGFTGTSFWLDGTPTHHSDGTICILLTNRVHLSRNKEAIFQLRQDFHREAVLAFRSSAQ